MKYFTLPILTSLLLYTQVYCQHIGVAVAQLWSDNYELENPKGIMGTGVRAIGSRTSLKLEYSLYRNTRTYYGQLKGNPFGPPQPELERIRSNSYVHAIGGSFGYKPLTVKGFSLEIECGLSVMVLNATREALTSLRTANFGRHYKGGIHFGTSLTTPEVSWAHMRLFFSGRYQVTTPPFLWVADVELPFHESIHFIILQLGVLYLLPFQTHYCPVKIVLVEA